jgi:hypothetical protein
MSVASPPRSERRRKPPPSRRSVRTAAAVSCPLPPGHGAGRAVGPAGWGAATSSSRCRVSTWRPSVTRRASRPPELRTQRARRRPATVRWRSPDLRRSGMGPDAGLGSRSAPDGGRHLAFTATKLSTVSTIRSTSRPGASAREPSWTRVVAAPGTHRRLMRESAAPLALRQAQGERSRTRARRRRAEPDPRSAAASGPEPALGRRQTDPKPLDTNTDRPCAALQDRTHRFTP